MLQRHGLNRAGFEEHPAPSGSVRLRQNHGDVVGGTDQGGKRGRSELRRAGKNQAHLHRLAGAFFKFELNP